MTQPQTNQPSELRQAITDICFENGGVTKPMVDKLGALLSTSQREAEKSYAKRINKVMQSYLFDVCQLDTNPQLFGHSEKHIKQFLKEARSVNLTDSKEQP